MLVEELRMPDEIGITLCDFAKGKTQPELAGLLDVSQSAVSQMLNSDRDIRIRIGADGICLAYEIRPIGSRKKQKAA